MVGSSTATHWFFINLDRSGDRRARLSANLDALGLKSTRVPAIDGRALTLPIPGIDPELYRSTHAREVTPAEIGCYLSHLRAADALLRSPYAHAVVLEDDAVITREAVRLVTMLTAPGSPDDWDVVKLEAHHRTSLNLPIRPLFERYCLSSLASRASGSAAYIINRRAAEVFLSRLLPMRVAYDHAFDRGWALGLRVRAIVPLPVVVDRSASTISVAGDPPRKLRGVKKIPSLLWRSKTETMRVLSAMHAWGFPTRRFPAMMGGRLPSRALADAAERAVSHTPHTAGLNVIADSGATPGP